MLVTINFHPVLVSYTGVTSHQIDVNKLSDIKDALVVLFPKLRKYINQILNGSLSKENLTLIKSSGKCVTKQEFEFNKIKDEELTLVPVIGGSGGKKGGFLAILIAVAVIVIAPYVAPGIAGAIGGSATAAGVEAFMIKMGIQMMISGMMQMMQSPPKAANKASAEEQQRRNNDMFDALENTTDPNAKIPIVYGMPRVAGQMLSGHVETMSHGISDTIYVRDLFYSKSNEILRAG